ncbi:hypothetical protein ElyMa_004031400 [Elysia marginata]|uniref:Uncharacterized protein n=1 Tax=Elysia marginata TaxID=1093978 RepID=A0AAV4G456_9GAST|nr:hypothetical protein ElyMa_004031400 [Elysia marginata]
MSRHFDLSDKVSYISHVTLGGQSNDHLCMSVCVCVSVSRWPVDCSTSSRDTPGRVTLPGCLWRRCISTVSSTRRSSRPRPSQATTWLDGVSVINPTTAIIRHNVQPSVTMFNDPSQCSTIRHNVQSSVTMFKPPKCTCNYCLSG